MNVTQVKNYPNTSKPKEILSDEIIETKTLIYLNLKMFADHLYEKLIITLR